MKLVKESLNEAMGKIRPVENVSLYKKEDWSTTNHSAYEFADYRKESSNDRPSIGIWRGIHNDMYVFTAEDWGETFFAWNYEVDDTPPGKAIKVYKEI